MLRMCVLALVALVGATGVLGAAAELPASGAATPYTYSTHWWTAQLDNFNFANSTQTFQLQYLLNTTHCTTPNCPIFFYSGTRTCRTTSPCCTI